MRAQNYEDKIRAYLLAKPTLSDHQLGVLLLLDTLYQEVPADVDLFRQRYAHLDPQALHDAAERVSFLKIARSGDPEAVAKQRLNSYINIKYNYLGYASSYEQNMEKFRLHSAAVSSVLDDLLATARFPQEVVTTLRERESVRKRRDFFDLLTLYRETSEDRVRFEILRKVGLIVLLSRLNHCWLIDDVDFAFEKVAEAFRMGLYHQELDERTCHHWLDENDQLEVAATDEEAASRSERASRARRAAGLPVFPRQVFRGTAYRTRLGTDVLHTEMRNKLRKNGAVCYTSIIEKIVRNNLEFPNQVHDVIGVKIVVNDEDEILELIADLEAFLGGSSTRKKEKNSLHKFGRRRLSPFSSKEYYVWKAVYDIILPHPSTPKVEHLLEFTGDNRVLREKLQARLHHFRQRQKNFVVEVQLQDIGSYLLSITSGSPTGHAFLKMNQIRANSFYKLFPSEIYEPSIVALRNEILSDSGDTR